MIRVAVLSEQIAAQLRTIGLARAPELENIDIVWSGTSLAELKQRGSTLKPHVVVIELSYLSEPYRPQLDSLLYATEAELILIPYSFARRDLIKQLSGDRTRAVKIPVSLAGLRLNMLSLLVRDAFHASRGEKVEHDAAAARSPQSPPAAPSHSHSQPATPVPPPSAGGRTASPPESSVPNIPVGTPRMFSPAQLGKLQEVASKVRCECTNHLAELCTSLAAFEEYSAQCEGHGDSDAAMHAYLYRETSRMRRLMEESLAALCRHEGIEA